MDAWLNEISLAVPEHDVHKRFISHAISSLRTAREQRLFSEMAERCQIDHRYSSLRPGPEGTEKLDADSFYETGRFPDTEKRMHAYRRFAFPLACKALNGLRLEDWRKEITHIIVTTCTGFYAPGIDTGIIEHFGLNPSVERTTIGFMGCQAGITALKLARHIVRSDAEARVLILNIELCTLHLQESGDLKQMLSFLIFADGCAASIVSSIPGGIELERFSSTILPESKDEITWDIGGSGFDMKLSGRVPPSIAAGLPDLLPGILGGRCREDVLHWAVHPGGRSILDAVKEGAGIDENLLSASRSILRGFGNMSSVTIMFVLNKILGAEDGPGCAMAFGPGLSIESMMFEKAGGHAS